MKRQEYIMATAQRLANMDTMYNANALCKETQSVCRCSAKEAVKIMLSAFGEALKLKQQRTK